MSPQSVKESRGSYLADVAKELVATASESSFDATTFFEKFELLAETEGAIKSIRDALLRLAVSGRLVSQNPEEEPAEKLILRISESLPSAKSGNPFIIKINCVIDAESLFELPSGWSWIPLGHIGIWATGCGFPKTHQGQTAGEYLFCKVSDMNLPGNDVEIRSTVNTIDEVTRQKIRAKANPPGTVIFPKIGGAIATHKRRLTIRPTIIDNNCSGIQPIGLTDNRWLHLLLKSIDLTKYQTGTSVPAVSQSALDPIRIALPPLAEQKRIVAKVDELMGLCDRLEALEAERKDRHASLSRAALARFAASPTPANLNYLFHSSFSIHPSDLRKSILTLAVQGKLVPQDPNDEPAEVLLRQIADHKAALAKEGRLRGSTTVKPMASDEAEFELPSNWAWVRFGEIMVNRDGERIPVSRDERETKAKTYDYYGASGVIDKIDGYLFDKPLLLIGEDGANLINRSTPIAFIARGKYWVNNHAHVLDGISEHFLKFIELHINAINLEKYITGSAQPKMNQAKMNSIPIALPPLAEQRRIVAKVEQLTTLVDQLEQQLAHSRTLGQQLLEAVVDHLTNATGQTEAG